MSEPSEPRDDDGTVGVVVAVCRDDGHRFSKPAFPVVTLLAGLGVQGDAHAGATVQHLFRVRRDPGSPNLRQVHLVHSELLDELAAAGYPVAPGGLGENVTTRGVDLLALGAGTRLHLGPDAVVRVTGLRNPCRQIEDFTTGLLKQVLVRDVDGSVRRLSGVMAVVETGGEVAAGDRVVVVPAAGEAVPLEVV